MQIERELDKLFSHPNFNNLMSTSQRHGIAISPLFAFPFIEGKKRLSAKQLMGRFTGFALSHKFEEELHEIRKNKTTELFHPSQFELTK